ncbi:MAG: hypothetical protein AAF739_00380 [Pseudomonadota bacterium]
MTRFVRNDRSDDRVSDTARWMQPHLRRIAEHPTLDGATVTLSKSGARDLCAALRDAERYRALTHDEIIAASNRRIARIQARADRDAMLDRLSHWVWAACAATFTWHLLMDVGLIV